MRIVKFRDTSGPHQTSTINGGGNIGKMLKCFKCTKEKKVHTQGRPDKNCVVIKLNQVNFYTRSNCKIYFRLLKCTNTFSVVSILRQKSFEYNSIIWQQVTFSILNGRFMKFVLSYRQLNAQIFNVVLANQVPQG